ncbi:MAG: MBL fold metallo-hydrolase [Acidobacteria bacterium]|nr:MBL fold metallo-hydrolase [Acidobacteriota bacterium]
MARIDEIAPDVFRISIYAQPFDLQFNHFLIKDDQPLLFHTGYKGFFPEMREAVSRLMDPSKLRWIGFSHFESDECGALNHWLEAAPQAQGLCSVVGAMVSVNDFAIRPPRGMADGETLDTGNHRYRFCSTAHLPHGWDAGLLFEEKQKTLLCSDLFHHVGDVEPITESDIVGRSRDALVEYQKGPLANYLPYTPLTGQIMKRLGALRPTTLATMHGSSFRGDCERAFHDLASVFRETLGTG